MNIKFVTTAKAKRSLLSCNDCRRRKKRCDELKPNCSSCIKRDVECVYSSRSGSNTTAKVQKRASSKPTLPQAAQEMCSELQILQPPFSFSLESSHDPVTGETVTAGTADNGMEGSKQPGIPGILETSRALVSTGSSPTGVSPLFQLNLDNISLSPLLQGHNLADMSIYESLDFKPSPMTALTLDLDLLAKSIVNSYSEGDLKNSYKFGQILAVLKPLSERSSAILHCFASILLALADDDRFEQFLLESRRLCGDLKPTSLPDTPAYDDELITYIVSLTCLSMIASITGNSLFWKETFEQLYDVLRSTNLKHLISVLSSGENKNALTWVIHWFFQQDITKMIKVTNLKKIGPMFSKLEYDSLLLQDLEASCEASTENRFKFDPIFSCCYELYPVMGSINKIYDEFLIRINGPIDHYYTFIKPTLDQLTTEEEKINFLNTEAYSKYEDTRIFFHDWVQFNTSRMEDRIVNCTINTNMINHLPEVEIEQIVKFFTLFQRSILLYLKIKLKELSAPTYEIKQLLLHMFKSLRELSGTSLNDYLLFPLLIVGASVYEYRDKLMVKSIYLHMSKTTKFKRNLNQIWKIIMDFWDINHNGVTFYMWQNAINKLDWNICIV